MKRILSVQGDLLQIHKSIGVRHYLKTQSGRVLESREYVADAVKMIRKLIGQRSLTFLELGCGCLDIAGPWSAEEAYHNSVIGYDCNEQYGPWIRDHYPTAAFLACDVVEALPMKCDVLVACEVLEHLSTPYLTLSKYAKDARSIVISHPLDEPADFPDKEHYWSLSMDDFKAFFEMNGFEIKKKAVKKFGSFNLVFGYGVNTNKL